MVRCPGCGADAEPPFCGYCGVPIEGDHVADVDIPAGDLLVAADLGAEPPPGQDSRSGQIGSTSWGPGTGGIDVRLPHGRVVFFSDPHLRLREAVVRAAFTARDASAAVGCIARQEVIDDGEVELFFEVHPGDGEFRLGRRFNIGTDAQVLDLVGWTGSRAVPAVGQPVVVELRVRGPVMQGWIGGQRVVQVTDPVLQTGRCGIRLSATRGDAHATLHGFEVLAAGSGR